MLHVVILPLKVLFATLFIILPVSEGILQYAVAPLLGVPLIMLFNMKGMDVIVAMQMSRHTKLSSIHKMKSKERSLMQEKNFRKR